MAISILTVGFLGTLTLLSRSLGTNRVISDNYTATYLAAEGIEVMKNILDANAIQGRAWNDGICNNTGAWRVDYATTALTGGAHQAVWLGNASARDTVPLDFDAFDQGAAFYQYAAGTATSYRRTVLVVCPSSNEVRINSIVDWETRGGGTFEVNLEDHFFNWR